MQQHVKHMYQQKITHHKDRIFCIKLFYHCKYVFSFPVVLHFRDSLQLKLLALVGIYTCQYIIFYCFQFIGTLKQLTYLDVSKNNIEIVEEGISGCESLQDLLLSSNSLQQLPETIGLYFQLIHELKSLWFSHRTLYK